MPDFSKYESVNFRVSGDLERQITERGENLNTVGKRDLERYYNAIPCFVPSFTEDEALFLCQVFNGSRDINPDKVWDDVAEAIQETQTTFDAATLLDRLNALSKGERIALVDAIERYWSGAYHKSGQASKIALRRVGLVK